MTELESEDDSRKSAYSLGLLWWLGSPCNDVIGLWMKSYVCWYDCSVSLAALTPTTSWWHVCCPVENVLENTQFSTRSCKKMRSAGRQRWATTAGQRSIHPMKGLFFPERRWPFSGDFCSIFLGVRPQGLLQLFFFDAVVLKSYMRVNASLV